MDTGASSDVTMTALLSSSSTGNAFEDAVARLMHIIKLGIVAEGDRLPPQRELAELLNVSRVTLREAIRALQQAGYVDTLRGRSGGTFVTYKPAKQGSGSAKRLAREMGGALNDALIFRRVVEPGAAAVAASRAHSGEEMERLRELASRVRSADAGHYRMADSRLHLAIAELSGSPSLSAAVSDIQLRLNDLLSAIPMLSPAIEHSHGQHDEIIDAIASGDAHRAEQAMLMHITATATLIEGFLS